MALARNRRLDHTVCEPPRRFACRTRLSFRTRRRYRARYQIDRSCHPTLVRDLDPFEAQERTEVALRLADSVPIDDLLKAKTCLLAGMEPLLLEKCARKLRTLGSTPSALHSSPKALNMNNGVWRASHITSWRLERSIRRSAVWKSPRDCRFTHRDWSAAPEGDPRAGLGQSP